MTRYTQSARRTSIAILALSASAGAMAQPAPAKPASPPPAPAKAPAQPRMKVPSAQEIQDKYIEVTGGKARYEAVKVRVVKGQLDMPTAGLKATLQVYQAPGNKFRQILEAPGLGKDDKHKSEIGKVEQGSDGKIVWELTEQYVRILVGEERENMLRTTNIRSELELSQMYPMMDSVLGDKIGEHETYKLILVTFDGSPVNRFYDRESGLLLRETRTVKNPQSGDIVTQADFDDYRDVSGLKTSFVTHQRPLSPPELVKAEQVISINSLEYPETVDPKIFELPDSVKDAVAKMNGDVPATALPGASPTTDKPPLSPGQKP